MNHQHEQPAGTVPVTPQAHTFPNPAELIADAVVWHQSSGMCHFGKVCSECDCGLEGATPERAREADQRELDTGNTAAKALEAAGLLAVTAPVVVRRAVGLAVSDDPFEVLSAGFVEVLRRLGYAGVVRVTDGGPFGVMEVLVAARRMTPEERAQ